VSSLNSSACSNKRVATFILQFYQKCICENMQTKCKHDENQHRKTKVRNEVFLNFLLVWNWCIEKNEKAMLKNVVKGLHVQMLVWVWWNNNSCGRKKKSFKVGHICFTIVDS